MEAKTFLSENYIESSKNVYGITEQDRMMAVIRNWHDDTANYDGRWSALAEHCPPGGRILDMAAGCGTFVLYGLHHGYDVYGIEPEAWKHEYFRMKIEESGYPDHYLGRLIDGTGEALPFPDEHFDLVTTYQTLEDVSDVGKCVRELLRVTKRGGTCAIWAPDYNCFYEPHYRLPFLPQMNKKLAAAYLKMLGRPTLGLQYLQWTTHSQMVRHVKASGYDVEIRNGNEIAFDLRHKKFPGDCRNV